MRSKIIITATLALASGCVQSRSKEYDLPLQEAYTRLTHADVDGFRFTQQCGVLIHFKPIKVPDNSVEWRVQSSGYNVLSFTVHLAALGPSRTRAAIEVPADSRGGEAYDGDKFYPHPAINQPLRPAVQELIDAAMEMRSFDVGRIPEPRNHDRICQIQRGALERGTPFRVDDHPNDPFPGFGRIGSPAWQAEKALSEKK